MNVIHAYDIGTCRRISVYMSQFQDCTITTPRSERQKNTIFARAMHDEATEKNPSNVEEYITTIKSITDWFYTHKLKLMEGWDSEFFNRMIKKFTYVYANNKLYLQDAEGVIFKIDMKYMDLDVYDAEQVNQRLNNFKPGRVHMNGWVDEIVNIFRSRFEDGAPLNDWIYEIIDIFGSRDDNRLPPGMIDTLINMFGSRPEVLPGWVYDLVNVFDDDADIPAPPPPPPTTSFGENDVAVSSEEDPFECKVCLVNKICMVLGVCGHTFCGCCVDVSRFECPMCRARFKSCDVIRAYFA